MPRSSLPSEPYARAITEGRPGALKGMRIGIIREFMVKHAKVDEPIVDAAAAEMKSMLGGHLGATLVESVTPGWVDDPDIENMTTTFDRAIAELAPVLYPDLLFRLTAANEPFYPDFAAKVKPTEFAPGVTRGTGTMTAADWMVRWAEGLEPSPRNLTLRSVLARRRGAVANVPLPYSAVPEPPREGLGRPRISRKHSSTGRRSMRDRSSGATTSVRRSRTGKRSTTSTSRPRALPTTSSGVSSCGA